MKKYLPSLIPIVLALLTIGPACSVINHKSYSNCDDGFPTGLSRRMPINGYYLNKTTVHFKHDYHPPEAPQATATVFEKGFIDYDQYQLIVFYEDGSECSIGPVRSSAEGERIIRYVMGIRGYKSTTWGRYRVDGDTIKVQSPFQLEALKKVIGESWYLINKDNTITFFAEYCRQARNKNFFDSRGFSTILGAPATYSFVPFPTKPDSMRSILRGKRWYKCK